MDITDFEVKKVICLFDDLALIKFKDAPKNYALIIIPKNNFNIYDDLESSMILKLFDDFETALKVFLRINCRFS